MVAARVGYQFRHLTNKKDIGGNREKNQILGMVGDDAEDPEMQVYVDLFRKLDEKRQGLDFEINDILVELDTVASFEELEHKKIEDIPEESLVGKLI